ncbi:MAG: LamG-like jellyroll fold domain-containing protein, partial [Roseibacillus sp.]
WVRLSIIPNAEPNIVGKGGDNNWRLTLNAGSSELIYHGGSAPISGGGSIAGPFWRHVVAISEAGVATRLYLDGLLVAVGGPPDLGSNGLPMEIGGNPELFDMNWNGLVDDVAVWNRALTTGELRQIWNAGLGVPIANLIVGTDGDSDGMSDAYETAHGLNPALDDSALDLDGDGLTNLEEHDSGSHPNNPDTDGDGLDDDAEAAAGTNPLGSDSDGDGLSDGEEISGSQNPVLNGSLRDPFNPASDPPGDPTNPLAADSDGDFWSDWQEVGFGSDPNDQNDFPQVTQIDSLGTGTGALLGGDLTDPEDNGIQGNVPGDWSTLNWNWVRISASGENYFGNFGGSEGAYDIFDNTVGPGQAKWCCGGPPQNLVVEFSEAYSLTHFTLTSGNDVPTRDPILWSIQGSNDGLVWDVLYPDPGFHPGPGVSLWPSRLEVLRFQLPKPTDPYKLFKYDVQAVVSGPNHQINELELFGFVPTPLEESVQITSAQYSGPTFEVAVEGLNAARSYVLRRATDGQAFTVIGTPFTGGDTHTFQDPSPPLGHALYQIWTTN